MATAFIALGSNLGDRQQFLARAVDQIKEIPQSRLVHLSGWYETKPVGGPPQGLFLNGAAQLRTELGPFELLGSLQKIEQELGRPSDHEPWASRVIDLDLLFYDDLILHSLSLTLPHPRLHERRFVLEPLHEIAPDWVHPTLKKSVKLLLQELIHAGRSSPE